MYPPERQLVIALHDVAPATWPACRRLLAALGAEGSLPITLLVVPHYHRGTSVSQDRDFCRAMEARLSGGDEVALHGFYHLDDGPRPWNPKDWLRRRVYTAGEGEFAALDETEAGRRIDGGLTMLEGLGWKVRGFVPPAWLLGPGGWAALRASSLLYTSTLRAIHHLPSGRSLSAPVLVFSQRSLLRRVAGRRWNPWRAEGLRTAPVLRLAIHPADASAEGIAAWRRLLGRSLPDRRPVLKSFAVATAFPNSPSG